MAGELKNALHKTDANQPAQNVKQLDDFLTKYKGQFALALPKHMNADRMVRLALTAFNGPQAQALRKCSMASIAAGIVVASQMGLEIGVGGQGYLIPYKGTAQFVPGWQGIVDLVQRAGRASVWTGAVFDGDDFDYALGDSPYVKHRPGGENDPKKLLYTYAIGRINGSQWPVIEVWSQARLQKHFHKNNKVGDRHYAHENWEMYARKIPLLQVCKYMPKSIELNTAMNIETAMDTGKAFTMEGEFAVIDESSQESKEATPSTPSVSIADATRTAIAVAATSEELDNAWNAFMNSPHDPEDEGSLGKLYAERGKALRG